jgi:hypothetical protein
MRADYNASLQDTGRHLDRSVEQDPGSGQEVETFTPGTVYDCGFDPEGGKEMQLNMTGRGSTADVRANVAGASVRLPLAAEGIDPWDRFELTHRHGEALSPTQVYDVVGYPERGPLGVVLNLQAINI